MVHGVTILAWSQNKPGTLSGDQVKSGINDLALIIGLASHPQHHGCSLAGNRVDIDIDTGQGHGCQIAAAWKVAKPDDRELLWYRDIACNRLHQQCRTNGIV